MRSISELITSDKPAWLIVQQWLADSPRSVEILPNNYDAGEVILLQLQIDVGEALGAVILETGGILLDNRWLRFLGAMNAESTSMSGDISHWNAVDGPNVWPGALIVAHDAVGGVFAINKGAFGGAQDSVFYFAPDTLHWEDLGISYPDLLEWAATGDVAKFYHNMRWPGWEDDVANLCGDEGFSIYPPLWTNQATPVSARARGAAPMGELWLLQHDFAEQIKDLPQGAEISIELTD